MEKKLSMKRKLWKRKSQAPGLGHPWKPSLELVGREQDERGQGVLGTVALTCALLRDHSASFLEGSESH